VNLNSGKSCQTEYLEPLVGSLQRGYRVSLVMLGLAAVGLLEPSNVSSIEEIPNKVESYAELPKTADPQILPSRDPGGWQNFKWGMTRDQARKLGAENFKDEKGLQHFGLPEVEIIPGKPFRVDLEFYSHIQLAYIIVYRNEGHKCGEKEDETLLRRLRKQHGMEKESKSLDYPRSRLFSHVWAIGTTRIKLIQSCSKSEIPASSNPSFVTSITYEKRRTIEPWNR